MSALVRKKVDIYRPVLSKEFSKKLKAKKITREDLLDCELTEVLRAATKCAYLRRIVRRELGFEPLPIKQYLAYDKIDYDDEGNETTYTDYKKVVLFPHQIKALHFMKEREKNAGKHYGIKGGIIRLEMGLGKSLLSITHALISPGSLFSKEKFPTLIIASKTVMQEWELEGFQKFFGTNVKVLFYHRDYLKKAFDCISREDIVKYDFVVTTYDVIKLACKSGDYSHECTVYGEEGTMWVGKRMGMKHQLREQADDPSVIGPGVLYRTPWRRIIADESHTFANPATSIFRAMVSLYGDYVFCLTGTAVRNYDTDIWSQLFFCGYNGVATPKDWKRCSYSKMKEHHLNDAILNMKIVDTTIKLPKMITRKHEIELSKEERECYNAVCGAAKRAYDEMMQGLVSFASILALLTRLRQCVIAPYLMTEESKRKKDTSAKSEDKRLALERLKKAMPDSMGAWVHDIYGTAGIYSTKISAFVDIIDKTPKDKKIIVFSMFTSCLDLLAEACRVRLPDFEFIQLDGDDKGDARKQILYQYKNDPKIQAMFMTYKVGSEGLNLTCATRIIKMEPWWSPAVAKQADARAYRPGQEDEVIVEDILVTDTVEDRIMEICRNKQSLSDRMLGESTSRVKPGLDKYTLGRILGLFR